MFNEENLFYEIKNEYKTFQTILIEKIKNSKISSEINSCYLVTEYWENTLANNLNKYETLIKQNKNGKKLSDNYCPKNVGIIDNIYSAINQIKLGKKIKLVSKRLIDLLYKEKNLIATKNFNYFAGNNLLIIEYKEISSFKSILILNPLDIILKNDKALIISFQTKNKENFSLYNKILTNKLKIKPNLLNNIINKNTVLEFKNLLNQENILEFFELFNENQVENKFNETTLKIMVYFYFYEKELIKKKYKELFSNNKIYYLINPNFIKEFKDFYDYNKIFNFLGNNDKEIKYINYSNLDKKIDYIMKLFSNEFKNFKKFDNKNEIAPILVKYFRIYYIEKGYLLPEKIKDMIEKCLYQLNNNDFKYEKIFAKENHICIQENLNIIVGILNRELIFFLKYIFSFKDKDILESELKIFNNYSILEYINLRKCKDKYNNTTQILTRETNEDNSYLGKFIISNYDNQSKNEIKNNHNIINNNSEEENSKSHKEIMQLEKKINNYKIQEKEFLNKLNILLEKIRNIEDENTNKSFEIEKLRKKISEKNENINNIKMENNDLKEENSKELKRNNEKELLIIKEKNSNLMKNINELTEKNKQLKEKEKNYLNKIKELENKIKGFKGKNNLETNIEKELKEKLSNISKKEEEINIKLEKIKTEEKNIEDKNTKIQLVNEQLKKDKEENEIIKKENSNLNKKNEELIKQIKENEIKYNNILENIDFKNKEEEIKKNYNDIIEQKNKEYQNLNIKYLDTKKQLDEKQLELITSVKLNKENESKLKLLMSKEKEVKDLEENIKKINEMKISQLNKEINDKNIEILQLKNIQKENNDLIQNNKKLISQIETINKDKNELNEKCKDLENQLIKEKTISKLDQNNIESEKELKHLNEQLLRENLDCKNKLQYMEIELKKQINLNKEYKKEKEEIINNQNNEYNKIKKQLNDPIFLKNQLDLLNNQNNNLIQEINNSRAKEKIGFSPADKESKNSTFRNEISGGFIEQSLLERDKYNFIPLIGLNNIDSTGFMNSTLQCLSQTMDLTKYFLDKNNEKDIKYNNIAQKNPYVLQLSPAYLELVQQLWEKNGGKSFSPTKVKNIIENMKPLFKQSQIEDSKDLIIFILDQLHKELKKPDKNNMNNINLIQPLNQFDKENSLKHFLITFQSESSIISENFFGITETTNECLYCKDLYNSLDLNNPICYNYQIFKCLIFPLEEVKNTKNSSLLKNNNIIMNQNDRISLYECFYYNQKGEKFTDQNQNYCNICKKFYDSEYTCKIFNSPNILILILNRGKGNIYNVKLDFNEKIDISEYVLNKEKPQIIYDLYGVITNIGQNSPNSHFVASCKNVDNKWYRFNNETVTPINNLQKEVIEYETPCILFYKKNN